MCYCILVLQEAYQCVVKQLWLRICLQADWWKLTEKAETTLKTSYRPELDVSPEIKPSEAAYFQSLIGILRWVIELGRIDICLEVSMISPHMALPQEGHLIHLLQVFSYLRKYYNSELVIDPSDPVIDTYLFEWKDWTSSEFGNINRKEEPPPNTPYPRGMGFVMKAKVDSDHAADTVTRILRTSFMIYLNCATVYWFSRIRPVWNQADLDQNS